MDTFMGAMLASPMPTRGPPPSDREEPLSPSHLGRPRSRTYESDDIDTTITTDLTSKSLSMWENEISAESSRASDGAAPRRFCVSCGTKMARSPGQSATTSVCLRCFKDYSVNDGSNTTVSVRSFDQQPRGSTPYGYDAAPITVTMPSMPRPSSNAAAVLTRGREQQAGELRSMVRPVTPEKLVTPTVTPILPRRASRKARPAATTTNTDVQGAPPAGSGFEVDELHLHLEKADGLSTACPCLPGTKSHQVQLISELSGGRADTQRNRLFALFAALFLAVALAIAAAGFLGGREHAKCLFCGAAGDMFYASAFFLVLSAICALRYGFSPRTVIRFYRAGMARRVPAMETEFRASGYTDAVAFVNAVLARGALLRKQAGIADSSAMKL